MASSANVALCAIGVAALWTFLGFAVARYVMPAAFAIAAAPILGWAIHSAVSLPILTLLGFSFASVASLTMCCLVAAAVTFIVWAQPSERPAIHPPWWSFVICAAVALVPAAAIVPKITPEFVQLADPIFDHSKIAMIDAMVRLGLPPVNPFFGENGEPGQLVYYYLYYFSAAQASLAFRVSGWEAEIAMTWFAAFSSLSLMTGIAVWLSGRAISALWALLFAFGTSLRDLLATLFGNGGVDRVLSHATGFSGWLFQAAWVPQHLTSASCVVLALLLLCQYGQYQTFVRTVVLALAIVAGFECSTYVGGIVFALTALFAVPLLYLKVESARCMRFIIGLGAAALLVVCLAAPFVVAQVASVGQRGTDAPIVLHHFDVLSEVVPYSLRRVLDLPAYWIILLPIEFPAAYIAGVLSLIALARSAMPEQERGAVLGFAVMAAVGAAVSWLLVGDLGGNNDLGMRAILPSISILTAAAAAGVVLRPRRVIIVAAAFGGFLLSVPHTLDMIRYNVVGNASAAGQTFAHTPELWAAVRRHTEPDRRVGNNPLFLKDMTPWPANISWALLADRSSCFAANELVLAYVPMPRESRAAIYAQFLRIFEGKGTPEDILDLANRYGCNVIVVTSQDGAWQTDPFAGSALYRQVDGKDGQWKIYKVVPRQND